MSKASSIVPISKVADQLGDRWKLEILFLLSLEPHRFGTLKSRIGEISHDQLSRKLNQLVELQWIARQEFYEYPPRVEYALTAQGRALVPLCRELFYLSLKEIKLGPSAGIEAITLFLRALIEFESEALGQMGMVLHGGPKGLFYVQFSKSTGHPVQFCEGAKGFSDLSLVLEVGFKDVRDFVIGEKTLNQIWYRLRGDLNEVFRWFPLAKPVSLAQKINAEDDSSKNQSVDRKHSETLFL
ncbi:MAG: helix-turn-helix transcriptional regulator [Oligoflexia bacterium]|nr:helix-turn-helix transcriptional regulator [Oligoflexia bacterium]